MAPSGRIALLICLSIGASAAETTVWRLGAIDSSAHEFAAAPNESAALPVVVRMGQGNEEKQWPGFQPGSANGRTGAKPYPYAIVFNLDRAPAGVFLLDLALLYRQPRTPAIQVEVNGRRGTYFFDPRISGELGGENDQFNAIVSTARRKVEIPARFFQQGENRITLTAIDEPAAVTSSSSVAGQGDSGVFYDALSLTNDPSAAPAQQLEAAFEPTIFYAADGSEECRVTLRYPSGWPGGEVRIEAGPYASTLPAPGGDLGEARFTVSIPESAGPHVARVEVRSRGQSRPQFFSLPFTPGRKWKLYYAPHEHLDIGYTDYRAKVAEVFGANIDRLLDAFAADPTYRFNFDASWVVKEWLA
ncbi:MAG: hypothetical protein LAQ30_31300, partial [Acidobacteriia bacterium]|nr:hypothetical protein [Terriglobia bacterium]